jgi:hypothetical protein
MHVETDHQRADITFAQMKAFLRTGWGALGERVAETWLRLNRKHFKGKLQPIPIVLTAVSPYGHWCGLTTSSPHVRRAHLIELTWPRLYQTLRADAGVLLHEMVHQHLTECGANPKHEAQAWCDEVMRLHFDITGKMIWAAPETVGKEKGDDGKRKSIRKQAPDPITGEAGLTRSEIAGWPHSVLDRNTRAKLLLGPF